MKTGDCSSVTPGEALNSWQKAGLNLVSSFGGRDVVLALDLTGSLEFNDQNRLLLSSPKISHVNGLAFNPI